MVGVERLLVVHTPLPWPEQADVAWVRVALPPEIVRQVVTPPRPEPHDLTVLATGRLSDARATDRFDCSLAPRELLVTPGATLTPRDVGECRLSSGQGSRLARRPPGHSTRVRNRDVVRSPWCERGDDRCQRLSGAHSDLLSPLGGELDGVAGRP